mgnify:CR=1 FL=1
MKLNNLTIAVLIAIGTAACGGSDHATTPPPHVDPTPAPTPQPDNNNNQAGRDDKGVVDPTDTHVVDNRDLSKESTVGGLQYIRRDGSQYDRANNPEQMASATPLLGVSLNEQNPKLTNIVLARRDLDYKDGEAVRAQFAGGTDVEPLTAAGKPREDDSLQVENFKNVDVLAGAFKQVGSAKFSDPNNRLDGTTHNIDTHIQNNTDKDGEFTRERVTHVFTPRYEYRQPYVDYPHAANQADIGKEHAANQGGPVGTSFTKPPAPPLFNNPYKPVEQRVSTIQQLEDRLANRGNNPEWTNWATRNYNDNSRHIANIGTNKDYVSGEIYNDSDRYGSFKQGEDDSPTDASGHRPATTWRNDGTTAVDPEDRDDASYRYTAYPNAENPPTTRARERNLVDWNGGRVNVGPDGRGKPDSGAYAGSRQGDIGITRAGGIQKSGWVGSNYQKPYPNGAYPKYPKGLFAYPNRPYDEANNNGIDTLINGPNTDPMDHEHIYLEREEYTAIRQHKGLRPLVNPVPNEWDWTLKQVWGVTYNIDVQRRSWQWIPTGPTTGHYDWVNVGSPTTVYEATPLSDEVKPAVEDNAHTGITANGSVPNLNANKRLTDGTTVCDGGATLCSLHSGGENEGWVKHLISAEWIKPENLGGGQRGEFRGNPYIGWKEDDRVVRFADERIWKPGAPGYKHEYENKYGANLIWWSTQDSAFENWATSEGWNPRARRVDINTDYSECGTVGTGCGEGTEDLVWGKNTVPHGKNARDRDVEIQPTGDITNGLIRIGSSMKTLGQEKRWNADTQQWQDWHNTKTRIFGRYHLAWSDEGKIKPVTLNSYSGARSFVARTAGTVAGSAIPDNEQEGWVNDGDAKQARYDTKADLDSAPVEWSIGAKPITLTKVQYGRVTTNLDLSAGEGPFDGGFLHAPFAHKNDKGSVDNYFYRGVEATSIEQMASLPNEGNVKYEGHALMYGINNDFLGFTEYRDPNNKVNLPNAFAREQIGGGTAQMGLGNFVQADVNFANKKVEGDVYNAWLKDTLVKDNPNGAIVKDLKVHFKGDIMGNTVVGSADRVYAPGDDKADFRASFFGDKAQEMGGAFNTVTREDKYGSAYETGDWGGVFGAARSSGSASNTFQGEDGANHYGNTTVTNNYER